MKKIYCSECKESTWHDEELYGYKCGRCNTFIPAMTSRFVKLKLRLTK